VNYFCIRQIQRIQHLTN